MSDTEDMLLFCLATFDQWTMSQFRFPVIKVVVIVMSRCHGAKKKKKKTARESCIFFFARPRPVIIHHSEGSFK